MSPSTETNHFWGKIELLSFLKRFHPPVKHLLISLRSTVCLHSTHQKPRNRDSINFVIESLMETYYTISSFIWTYQLEWPNYIKTYMHFFAECLQACTVYMYNSPYTRLNYHTSIRGKPNHLGHQICSWVQQIINALKCQNEHFSYVKEYKYEATTICGHIYQLHNTQNVLWVEYMQIWVETVHTHTIFLVC
jgi:hypothetical protein